MTVWMGLVAAYRMKSCSRGYVKCVFGFLSVFRRRIKGMIWLRPEQVWTDKVTHSYRTLLSILYIPGASVLKSGESL
jgi:hypothetical protein